MGSGPYSCPCPPPVVRGRLFLRTSPLRPSAKSINLNTCNYRLIPDDRSLPSGVARLSGWGYAGVHRRYIVGPVTMPPGKEPHREEGRTLWATTHEEEDPNEPKRAMGSVCDTDPTGRRGGSPNYCWSGICQG